GRRGRRRRGMSDANDLTKRAPTDRPRAAPLEDGRAGPRSKALFEAAQRVIPGGVNSPVRAFASVGGDPPFIRKATGCHLVTEDGAALIDYVGSWGPALL